MDIEERARIELMLRYEKGLKEQGYHHVAGIDEAGRGPLCGPVVAAAVILPDGFFMEGINDSKKISQVKREKLYEQLMRCDIIYGVGVAEVAMIEQVNILNATKYAMKMALEQLTTKADFVLIDGNQKLDITTPQETIVSGDGLSLSIATASIIAKVTRDNMMKEWDRQYPMYGFSKNKGYGTKAHIEAIAEYGLCDIHRPSFCKHFVVE